MGNRTTKSEQEGDVANTGQESRSQPGSVGWKGLETQRGPPAPQLAQDVAKQIDTLQSIIASRSRCQTGVVACKYRIAALQNRRMNSGSIKSETSAEPELVEALHANVVVSFGAGDNTYCTLSEEGSLNSPAPVQSIDAQPDKSVVGQKRDFQENRGERNGILHNLPAQGNSMRRSIFVQGIFARGCLCVVDQDDAQMHDNHQKH